MCWKVPFFQYFFKGIEFESRLALTKSLDFQGIFYYAAMYTSSISCTMKTFICNSCISAIFVKPIGYRACSYFSRWSFLILFGMILCYQNITARKIKMIFIVITTIDYANL